MLDGLLGRGFAAKCKALIKLTKSRIDVIRRKRKATEKFLKKDIADLLANGLDINAYGRAEGLLAELTLSSCYNFVEQSCDFVLKHLSVMQKLSGCPEECREAVSSLMISAARFSDLPELRDLRQIFQEKYGTSMECYVNQEFAANLNSRSSPTLENKVHLMQEIASEFSIMWDSKAFEQRMLKPSAIAQDHNIRNFNHLTGYGKPSHDKNAATKEAMYDVLLQKSPDHPKDGRRFHNGKEAEILTRGDGYGKPSHGKNAATKEAMYDALLQKSPDHPKDGRKFHNGKEAEILTRDGHNLQSKSKHPSNGFKQINGRDEVNLKKHDHDNIIPGRQDFATKKSDRSYRKEDCVIEPNGPGCSSQGKRVEKFEVGIKVHHSKSNNTTSLRESHDTATSGKPDSTPGHAGLHVKSNVNEPSAVNHGGLPDFFNSERKVQKDETPRVKSYYNSAIPPPYVKPNSKQKNSTCEANEGTSHVDGNGIAKHPSVYDQPHATNVSERSHLGSDNSDPEKQARRHARLSRHSRDKDLIIQEDLSELPAVTPKSMRRKHSKSSRSSHNDDSAEDTGVVTRRSRSRSGRRDGSRNHGLQNLFADEQHRNDEEDKMIDRLLIHYSKKPSIPLPEKARRKSKSRHAHQMDESRGGPDETPEMVSLPPRSISLPREETGAEKVNKVFNRAASFQPDRSNEARHVHPNLPDYDDLAARIAALRGT